MTQDLVRQVPYFPFYHLTTSREFFIMLVL